MTIAFLVILVVLFLVILFTPTNLDLLEKLMEDECNGMERKVMLDPETTQEEKAEIIADILNRLKNKGLIDFKGNAMDQIEKDKL